MRRNLFKKSRVVKIEAYICSKTVAHFKWQFQRFSTLNMFNVELINNVKIFHGMPSVQPHKTFICINTQENTQNDMVFWEDWIGQFPLL